jgi:hypothetical protein
MYIYVYTSIYIYTYIEYIYKSKGLAADAMGPEHNIYNMYVCIYVCMYVCMYICIYIYILW